MDIAWIVSVLLSYLFSHLLLSILRCLHILVCFICEVVFLVKTMSLEFWPGFSRRGGLFSKWDLPGQIKDKYKISR